MIDVKDHSLLTVVTYNVHGCAGYDGKVSTVRVGDVIAQFDPDVVALQELDLGRARSGRLDQPRLIAEHLNMDFHFSPAFTVQEEQYGNAILSRLPMRLMKSGPLPTLFGRKLEKRGAVWAEVTFAGTSIQVINTHMGLNWMERKAQADALLGPEWLGSPACGTPLAVCGDFNLLPSSAVYQSICTRLLDAQNELARTGGKRPRSTWPSFLPIARLDHIFISPGLEVAETAVPHNSLSRGASDHLPLMARLRAAGPARQ